MEVGEHLPTDAATILVQSLCAHSPVVVFSAAIPRQGGVEHINEQWQSYWANLFAKQGYAVYDCVRPRVWELETVAEYYRQNTLVYVKRENQTVISLFEMDALKRSPVLDIVHPASYGMKADPLRWPLAEIFKSLPRILWRVMRNRVLPRR
jgi:hypothetical protein